MIKMRMRLWEKVKNNPTLDDIVDFLNEFKGSYKQLELERFDAPVPGPKALFIEGYDGLYTPTLGFFDGNNSSSLRYKNPKADDSWVDFGGYEYPMEILTDDFDLIVSMVKEFYETGTVKILNHVYDFSKSDRV